MVKTVFYQNHINHGGRMVDYAGFNMPVEFSGVKNEHNNVREKVGIFDVSHMGEIVVKGDSAASLVQYLTTNDIQKLSIGQVQYSCLPNGKGGVVDDLLVYKKNENEYLLVVNAANVAKDWEWINANNKFSSVLINESEQISQLALQGPLAKQVLQKITDLSLEDLPYYWYKYGSVAGIQNVLISNTGYTGSGGYELYFPNKYGPEIFDNLMEAGKEFDIIPAGLASRDTLRLESGFCLYGNELSDSTSPLEAGLAWIVKFVPGNDFIDRDFLEKQKEEGLKRKLLGFELLERGIPRNGYSIFNKENIEIGMVTSGTMSPYTNKAIGMGYVKSPEYKELDELYIGIRNKRIPAKVVRPPFFKRS